MKAKGYSRREFIKNNSLAGLGMALTIGPASALFTKNLSSEGNISYPAEQEPPLYFDAYTRIGPRRFKHPAERWSLDDLVQEMDHCSISGALVAYTLSVSYDLMYSNLELSEMLKPYPYLFGIWNAMPHHSGEFPPPPELGMKMREHNVRAISLHPDTNNWDWKAETSRELMDWLSENRILTIVNVPELGGWTNFDTFLERYPSLPVLLMNAAWSEQRYLLPLLDRHRNLHISFNRFQINEGIEYLYENGHADQLIFASAAPGMSAGAHRCYIDYADIAEETRAKVAGGNLIRLLKGQKPPATRANHDEDELMSAVRHGQSVPVPVLDMHMHILHEGLHGAGGHYRMRNGGPEGVFAMMNLIGNQGGGIMSWNGVVSGDAVGGNDSVRQALDVAPPGYWGLATFDPSHYSQEQLEKMIPELYRDRRFIGMKPYPFYGIEYHHPSYDVWWEYGNRHKLYALIHRSRQDALEVETLAEKYPDVRWVIAHAGGSYQWADIAISAMKKYPNIYAELTYTSVPLGIIEYLANHAGQDRILYGSDLPMRDPRQQIGWVIFSRLPVESKKKILAGNSLNVIEPCLNRLPAHNRPVFNKSMK